MYGHQNQQGSIIRAVNYYRYLQKFLKRDHIRTKQRPNRQFLILNKICSRASIETTHSKMAGFPTIHADPLCQKYGPNTDPGNTDLLQAQKCKKVCITDLGSVNTDPLGSPEMEIKQVQILTTTTGLKITISPRLGKIAFLANIVGKETFKQKVH